MIFLYDFVINTPSSNEDKEAAKNAFWSIFGNHNKKAIQKAQKKKADIEQLLDDAIEVANFPKDFDKNFSVNLWAFLGGENISYFIQNKRFIDKISYVLESNKKINYRDVIRAIKNIAEKKFINGHEINVTSEKQCLILGLVLRNYIVFNEQGFQYNQILISVLKYPRRLDVIEILKNIDENNFDKIEVVPKYLFCVIEKNNEKKMCLYPFFSEKNQNREGFQKKLAALILSIDLKSNNSIEILNEILNLYQTLSNTDISQSEKLWLSLDAYEINNVFGDGFFLIKEAFKYFEETYGKMTHDVKLFFYGMLSRGVLKTSDFYRKDNGIIFQQILFYLSEKENSILEKIFFETDRIILQKSRETMINYHFNTKNTFCFCIEGKSVCVHQKYIAEIYDAIYDCMSNYSNISFSLN